MVTLARINSRNRELVSKFIANAGNSVTTFRYYNSRSLDVISNHLVTVVAMEGDEPVGYGHLDKENEITWLGIAVAHSKRGAGIGNIIMDFLVQEARLLNVSQISLTVDKENIPAIKLYGKFGFINTSEALNGHAYLMKLDIND
jgi:ribosomal protein S18 acetylase RimI-like enzyme